MMCMYDRCMYDVYTDIGQYQYCFLILNQSYLCLHILCIKITSIDRQLSKTIHAEPGRNYLPCEKPSGRLSA